VRVTAHVAVDACGVGPIRLDGDDFEPVFFNQAARDRCAGLVEFRRAMARLPEKDNLRVRKTVETRAKRVRLVWRRKGFAMGANDGSSFIGAFGTNGLGKEDLDHVKSLVKA